MALSADDVMLLLCLLLGTGQRILLEVQATEQLSPVGGRERRRREGQGQESKSAPSGSCLLPLFPAPSTEGSPGNLSHTLIIAEANQHSLGPVEGVPLPLNLPTGSDCGEG